MQALAVDPARIRAAWQGRISGCLLGKPVEVLSAARGHAALSEYLGKAGALPLRDYVPLVEDTLAALPGLRECTRGNLTRCEPDDDINYSVLALMLLEQHGAEITTEDVARGWIRWLPAGMVFTAERAAYQVMLAHADIGFSFGGPLRGSDDQQHSHSVPPARLSLDKTGRARNPKGYARREKPGVRRGSGGPSEPSERSESQQARRPIILIHWTRKALRIKPIVITTRAGVAGEIGKYGRRSVRQLRPVRLRAASRKRRLT